MIKSSSDNETARVSAPSELQIQTYAGIFRIENFLRELIVEELSKFGTTWRRQNVPEDVRTSMREGLAYERTTPLSRARLPDPIYYVDFPDLRKIITRNDNWEKRFRPLFISKPRFEAKLSELEPIRNALAHNRSVLPVESDVVTASEVFMANHVGIERYRDLSARESRTPLATELLSAALNYCGELKQKVRACEELCEPTALNFLSAHGLLDEVFLGSDPQPLLDLLSRVVGYRKLPRGRGEGHLIELYCQSENLEGLAQTSEQFLSSLLA